MLFLVKNGVPWDVADSLDEEERQAYVIIMGGFCFEDAYFDWPTATWQQRRRA